MLKLFLFLLIFIIPAAFATSTTSQMTILLPHYITDEIKLDEDQILDLTDFIIPIREEEYPTSVTIGSVTETLSKQVWVLAENEGEDIPLVNTSLDDITIVISDSTNILAPESWNGEISPPLEIDVTGNIPSGFQTPENVIQTGNADTILIFDKTVTIILEDVTGQIAYRLPGESTWNLINKCNGTYETPIDPVFPKVCSISDGDNTKIVTYHFTEFAEFEEIEEEVTDPVTDLVTSSSSSGGGRTGISVPNPKINDEIKSSNILPMWLTHPVLLWNSDQITAQEFSSIMGWLIDEDVIKIENKSKPEKQIITMTPSTKHLFSLWEKGILSESIILNLIEKYREYGIW